jgi:hypothetical protein
MFAEQVDMYRDISESKREIEEEQSWKRAAYGREKDHLGSLEVLGLNEQEALEYVLMLSRDEEGRDPTSEHSSIPPSSNTQVRDSPRAKLEARPAGVAGSPGSPEMVSSVSTGSDLSDEKEFPAVGESVSSRGSGISGIATPLKPQRSNGSPPSAWNSRLKTPCKTGNPSSNRATATVLSPRSTEWGNRSTASEENEEDEDLKLAIELSLAEASKKKVQRTLPAC